MNGKRIAVGLTVLLLAGCGGQRTAPPAPPPTVLPSALAADRYLEQAASASLFMIRASDLAQSRSRSAAVRAFARTARGDHEGIGSQLSFAGRRLNLLPSATLLPTHRATLSALETSAAFDADYRRSVERVLRDDYALHAAFARSGSSATLRPVATMAAPIVGRELASVRGL
jgi:putative membrane protein